MLPIMREPGGTGILPAMGGRWEGSVTPHGGSMSVGVPADPIRTWALPCCMQVDARDVLDDPATLLAVGEAVSAGATAVVLREGGSSVSRTGGGGGGGATQLYEAACALREALRGRAALLLVDRTDVAMAAEADGVLLTDLGEQYRVQLPHILASYSG